MRAERFTAGRWLGLSVGILAVAALVATGLAFVAAARLSDARERLVDRVDPSQTAALTAQTAVVSQETAVRGYLLGGREEFLAPYAAGRLTSDRALRTLDGLAARSGSGTLRADLALVRTRIDAWREDYARPAILRARAVGPGRAANDDVAEGKARFDAVRRAFGALQENQIGRAHV